MQQKNQVNRYFQAQYIDINIYGHWRQIVLTNFQRRKRTDQRQEQQNNVSMQQTQGKQNIVLKWKSGPFAVTVMWKSWVEKEEKEMIILK